MPQLHPHPPPSPYPTFAMQAYSIHNVQPVCSMRDQAITSLSAVLRHVRVLINTAPQPEESLEAIYEWAEDWDQTWAGIYSWWKYVNENKISILKVHNANLCDMTEESAIQKNEAIPTAIAIADLQQPEGQCRFNINDLFEDYQEQVEERAWLEAKRLAKAPSMCTWGQAARGEGQDCTPEDTKGNPSRGVACSTGEGPGSASKKKGKQKEDELADDIDNDKGNGKPGPSTKGPHAAGDNEPCETCAQEGKTQVLVLLRHREKVKELQYHWGGRAIPQTSQIIYDLKVGPSRICDRACQEAYSKNSSLKTAA
ncbi:hypothetical protein F5J12DRAFT_894769 [Pisolithus orientalis]|uniref:uncharacterized protein n=1 Tax=Pisolithus orientalis TaxID=936130 RepID=UPI0022253D03|nr:uncharacterized protein F5J12DRAFT_894769 [Pisolithus orientalis]KAI6000319.1 hypothetical protein F5J12DRAFT_894769 [Pisolithus orientalis]